MYKLFVDAHVFDGEFQGTLTYIKEIYLKLLDSNTNMTIYFGANDPEKVQKVFGNHLNVKYVQYTSTSSWKRIFIEIPKIIDKFNCTHAHFQYIIPFKKNKNCKYIVTIHDILFNDFPNKFSLLYRFQRNFLFYLSAKFCDCLLTVSNYSKQKISKRYNIDPDKIIVTPNAVSEDFFDFLQDKVLSKKYIEKKYALKNYILYVSRIEPRKNQTLLLKLFVENNLYKQGYQLVLIGSNTLESDLFENINDLDNTIRKNIHWIEQVDFVDLRYFLNAAELFVYPSKAEGFGIPPLEAGALGTPVLCSAVTAMKDFYFFQPYMFDPDDYDEFEKKLLDILNNKEYLNVGLIQERIKEHYSWDTSAKILYQQIENL